ncbi:MULTISPECIES: DUF58 domain-containing protein [Bhargavaea]|uniref:DUF58 domain-containing protein n=1 Tax=Bhargavaea changchunensis TaxID=2134037 RepID=A0ABW2NIC3_9BACL|nr:DUF58 domain-containing protein [Bhargavaea sp. CC-171006]
MNHEFHHELITKKGSLAYVSISSVIGLLAILGKNVSLGVLAVLMLVLYGLNVVYVQKAARNIRLRNGHEFVRLFPGEEGELTFDFINVGKLAVWNVRWEVSVLDHDGATEIQAGKIPGILFPSFFLPGKGSVRHHIRFAAKKRGLARASVLTLHIGDLLGVFRIRLTYQGYLQKAVIVYPGISGFKLPSRLAGQFPGVTPAPISLFEERTRPRGTREYAAGDPFSSIAWKETARTGGLRTKDFDRVVLQRWILVADLRGSRPGAADHVLAEKVFSQIAHAAMAAEKRGIEFEVRLNMRTAARDGHLHIPPDHGRAQLSGVLNRLARLPANSPVSPPAGMYRSIAVNAMRGHVLFHFGKQGGEFSGLAALLKKRGVTVIQVSADMGEDAG